MVREADARASSCLTVRGLGHGGGDGVHDKHAMAWSREGDAVVLEALGIRPSRKRVAGVLHSGDKLAGGRVEPAERGESNGVEHIAASEDSGEIAEVVGGREARRSATASPERRARLMVLRVVSQASYLVKKRSSTRPSLSSYIRA